MRSENYIYGEDAADGTISCVPSSASSFLLCENPSGVPIAQTFVLSNDELYIKINNVVGWIWHGNPKSGMKIQKGVEMRSPVAVPALTGGDCFCSWADITIQSTPRAG